MSVTLIKNKIILKWMSFTLFNVDYLFLSILPSNDDCVNYFQRFYFDQVNKVILVKVSTTSLHSLIFVFCEKTLNNTQFKL
jgi:hypothetical protein